MYNLYNYIVRFDALAKEWVDQRIPHPDEILRPLEKIVQFVLGFLS
jgi:hypothetical protein